ncbi:MAG TPA: hypothetical protein DEG17_18055 [Cyanobacteria bacterium UBA11149]|nr:hypothetical protein [Cyanobacteria bacterium UBA11367]HBE56104.1 hypothetical protein [Cyanobacteria bacterium UBA11366]HBK65839.1 hypothetical protein [Cyanobacteria bacterium UBA11166]HBR75151.1 hypothetical protein [Cyanobacteria bacterium UBA11159]HBS70106.1 hypothetical protein [Cyanobacteria bacterium UBA11153]HBW90722.1 hypothetical protein [Cyanobacteria bacterium UBA11149]HCA93442.1 hypothetical protein [Cyanobacteria bacterium UBA9226]
MVTPTSRQDTSVAALGSRAPFKVGKKKIVLGAIALSVGLLGIGMAGFTSRYNAAEKMSVNLKELSNSDYPANAAPLSKNFQRYANRELIIIKRDDTHFDFVLQPKDNKTAKIVIKNIDLSLLTPKPPEWTKKDPGLEVIALTDREWNRQQVSFPADSAHIEITGGDGFEQKNLAEVALANNCLNAGYWEVLLFTKEDNNKSMYYQGWFTFPMGHYKDVFEKINNISYTKHLWRLEHWQDPAGTIVNTKMLREVIDEKEIAVNFPLDERIIASGEQARKVRTTLATNLTTWGDFYSGKHDIKFATFRPPGYYDAKTPWQNEYWRIGKFDKGIVRNIKPAGNQPNSQEIELTFRDTKTNEQNRLIISGVNLKDLPKLPLEQYNKGLYMPMGIGVPPFYQNYSDLEKSHPDKSPYFNVLLNSQDKWIDHHKLALDGVAMHLDKDNPNLVHLYLLSYERNTVIGHFSFTLE